MNAPEYQVGELIAGDAELDPTILSALAGDGAALYGLPAADYHKAEALSSSGARKLRQSPMHYKLMRDEPSEPTEQMQFGTCVHDGVLEPDAFESRVCGAPKVDKRTKEGKATWEKFVADNAGKIVLPMGDFDRARRCIDAVLAHPAASQLLAGAVREVSLFWRDGKYKVPCKARIDIWNHGGLTDLKTTTDASAEAFARSIANYDYHAQLAHYASGCEHVLDRSPEFCCFIAVESEKPHAVAVYELPGNAMLAGMHLMNIAAQRYADALAAGKWSGYPETIQTIALPRWALSFPAY